MNRAPLSASAAAAATVSNALERTVLPGTRLGRYEIITHLAAGGMAAVFLARLHGVAGFQRLVAIKLLHPHIAADEQFTTMLLDEARLAARIRHPNVVPTVDLQHGPEGHYLVMEFIEGESLLGILRQTVRLNRPMPAGIAIRIMLDILSGLHAAHDLRGDLGEPLHLVHRDVSPHNILVGVDGVARIVDFGIARAEERIGTTRDGQLKGKLAYMAPEQTNGEPVDRRVDVFTAGIVLFESLSGRRLFRGQTDAEVLRNLVEKPIPRLREVSPGYPQSLDDVCARALRRDPEERFETAADFADAIEEAAEPLGIATPRQVGSYVRDVAGEVIESVMRRARAFQEGARISSNPPPAARGGPALDEDNPDSTIRVSSPVSSGAASGPTAKELLAAPNTGADRTSPLRRPMVVAVSIGGLAIVAAFVITLALLVNSSHATPPNPAASAAPAETAENPAHASAAQESASASAVAPSAEPASAGVSITDLPRADNALPVRRHRLSVTAPPTAPTNAAPTQTTTPTTNPTPPATTATAFNPESM